MRIYRHNKLFLQEIRQRKRCFIFVGFNIFYLHNLNIEQTFKEIHTITIYNRDSEESFLTYVNLNSFADNKVTLIGTNTSSVHLAESDAKLLIFCIFSAVDSKISDLGTCRTCHHLKR